jgi:hypothetical protein
VEVLQLPPVAYGMRLFVEALLIDKNADLIPVAVMREESDLFKPGTRTRSSLRTGYVLHPSLLCVLNFDCSGRLALSISHLSFSNA